MANIKGTTGDDSLVGTAGNDNFNVTQGGNDTVSGGDGNDTINFGASLTAADTIDGGAGSDRVILSGDYSAGIAFADTTMTSIEEILLRTGSSYRLTTADGNLAAGGVMTINGAALGVGDALTFSGGAETDGRFHIIGGKGDDRLSGGAINDVIDISHGGEDSVQGFTGNDIIKAGNKGLDAGDTIRGGDGNDTIEVTSGGANLVLGATTLLSVERMLLTGTGGESITLNAATIAAGETMIFDASAMAGSFDLDATAKDAGNIHILGGAKADAFTFGAGLSSLDTISGGGGSDHLTLDGDYSAGLTLDSASPITGIHLLTLTGPFAYNIDLGASSIDGISATGAGQLTIDGSHLAAPVTFLGGTGNDTFIEGNEADVFEGNDGDDTLIVAAGVAQDSTGKFDGGAGYNKLVVYSQIPETDLHHVNEIDVMPGSGGYGIYDSAQWDRDGNALRIIDAHELGTNEGASFTGYDGRGIGIAIGGAGADEFMGSQGSQLTGNGGADVLYAGVDYVGGGQYFAGDDNTIIYHAVSDSTGAAHDTVWWFAPADHNVFELWTAVTGVDPTIMADEPTGDFDTGLAAVVGPSQLAAHHAVFVETVVNDQSGPLGGSDGYIVVDINGVAGYQAGQDLVIAVKELWSNNFTTANFTTGG